MKKIFFIAWSFFTLSSLHAMQEANETNLIDASIDFRTFYYYGERENRAEREALAIGGILKATTQKFYGLSGSVAFYTSHDMLHYGADADMRYGTFDRSNIAGGSELVLNDGDAIDTIGEAYIEYSFAQTSLRYGRQRINTPLVNDFYNRFLPNSFEAITLESHEIENTKLFLSNISRWKYKSEADFKKFTTDSSSFKSLYIAGVEHTLTKDTKFSLYYYRMPQMLHSGYIEVDTSESLTQEINLRTQLHYLYQKSLQDALLGDIDTYLAGAKITLDYRNSWYLSALLDKVGNDTIRATGADYANLGLSSFINYTDLQIDGEALNAKALSYGIILGYKKTKEFDYALKYVKITQDTQAQLESITPNKRPSSDEFNIDLTQNLSKEAKIRLRYASINYAKQPLLLNEFDEHNLRIIFDYNFKINKK